jgi:hypothetical protein
MVRALVVAALAGVGLGAAGAAGADVLQQRSSYGAGHAVAGSSDLIWTKDPAGNSTAGSAAVAPVAVGAVQADLIWTKNGAPVDQAIFANLRNDHGFAFHPGTVAPADLIWTRSARAVPADLIWTAAAAAPDATADQLLV